MQVERNVIDARLAEDNLDHMQEIAITDLGKIRARWQELVLLADVGAEQSAPVPVDDGDIEDRGRVANHRVEQRREPLVFAQRRGDGLAQSGRIVRIHGMVTDPCVQSVAGGKENLMGEDIVGYVGLLDLLAQELAEVKRGEDGNQDEDKSGDGQHEFGLQPH